MARDVNEILVNICDKEGQMGHTQAQQFVKDLGQKSRYVLDVWS
jgi:sulfite reductase alpha subunit-like flavoprotein